MRFRSAETIQERTGRRKEKNYKTRKKKVSKITGQLPQGTANKNQQNGGTKWGLMQMGKYRKKYKETETRAVDSLQGAKEEKESKSFTGITPHV